MTNAKKKTCLQQMCNTAKKGDTVFRIPYTVNNKTMIIAPNYILEALIGILLYKSCIEYSPAFMYIYGFQYDNTDPQKSLYVLSEKLEPLDNYIVDKKSYLYFMFAVIQGLNVSQKIGRFTHYDLHKNNVMARNKKKKQVKVYDIGNGEYLYTYYDFEPVIIDYGFSRYETAESIMIPSFIYTSNNREIVDWYEFNPYYDIFSLIIDNWNKQKNGEFPNFTSDEHILHYKLINLFSNIYEDENVYPISYLSETILTHNFRPFPEMLNCSSEYKSSTTGEMMVKLANLIKRTLPPFRKVVNYENIVSYLQDNNMLVLNKLVTSDTFTVYKQVPSNLCMDTTYYNYIHIDEDKFAGVTIRYSNSVPRNIRTERASFNHGDWRPVENQHIHTAIINQKASKKLGYKFRFDCCRVDLMNYFQNKHISGGIAINASFYQNKNSFKPIGYFKTKDTVIDNPIPSGYEKYYGIIATNDKGELVIDKYTNRYNYDQVFSTGPILIDDDKHFDDYMIANTIDEQTGKYVFQCDENSSSNMISCNNIHPGELVHASNQNPRTALAIKDDGTVIFIYVEGRNKRGSGMDLSQMTQLCLSMGAVSAVNLDGGRSSQFIWKKPGSDIIYNSNPDQKEHYPVGSVISYVKMK